MTDKTTLVVPGKKLSVPRIVKRLVQITAAVALTSLVVFLVMLGNGLLQARGTLLQSYQLWLGFMKRPDIQTVMVLTAVVSVLFVYWQRDRERERR